MKYLLTVTEVFRADTEAEAKKLIETAKASSDYSLIKYSCNHKERKQKGEVIDDWYNVSLTKFYNNEKEPEDVYYGEDEV